MAKIEYIVVHHTATPRYWTTVQLRDLHVNERGWRDIGYHYVIRQVLGEVLVEEGRPQDGDDHLEPWEYGAHVQGSNARSLGICVVGNFSKEKMPPMLKAYLLLTLYKLCKKHDLDPMCAIRGHREMPKASTECPGTKVDMTDVRAAVKTITLILDGIDRFNSIDLLLEET